MTKSKILIVDDEVYITTIVSELLEDKVDHILTAKNGQEALDLILKEAPDCILSDITMPVMDGITLIKECRSRNITTPFIFYTAHGTEKLMVEALAYGAFDFIDKPELTNLDKIVIAGICKGRGLNNKESETVCLTRYKSFCRKELKK